MILYKNRDYKINARFRRRGFTIVELLVVIVVIGILATISIVSYRGISQRAKESAIASEAAQLVKSHKTKTLLNNGEPPSDAIIGQNCNANDPTTLCVSEQYRQALETELGGVVIESFGPETISDELYLKAKDIDSNIVGFFKADEPEVGVNLINFMDSGGQESTNINSLVWYHSSQEDAEDLNIILDKYYNNNPNQTYTLSFDIKTNEVINSRLDCFMYKLGNKYKFSSTNPRGIDDSIIELAASNFNQVAVQKRFSGSFRLSISDNNSLWSLLVFRFSNVSWANFSIRNVKIELGNRATPWSPSPYPIVD